MLINESATKDEAVKKAQTVIMFLNRHTANPGTGEGKINTATTRFKSMFTPESASTELMKLAGFEYRGDHLAWSEGGAMADARMVLDLLSDAVRKFDKLWARKGAKSADLCSPKHLQHPRHNLIRPDLIRPDLIRLDLICPDPGCTDHSP